VLITKAAQHRSNTERKNITTPKKRLIQFTLKLHEVQTGNAVVHKAGSSIGREHLLIPIRFFTPRKLPKKQGTLSIKIGNIKPMPIEVEWPYTRLRYASKSCAGE
jgi:hypothetical protein